MMTKPTILGFRLALDKLFEKQGLDWVWYSDGYLAYFMDLPDWMRCLIVSLLKQVTKMGTWQSMCFLRRVINGLDPKAQCPICENSLHVSWNWDNWWAERTSASTFETGFLFQCVFQFSIWAMWVRRAVWLSIKYFPYLDMPANFRKLSTSPVNLTFLHLLFTSF